MNTAIPPLYTHHPYAEYRFENSTRYYSQPAMPDPVFDDEDQIPSTDDFKCIIDDYLNNLSPKKRDKALVDQHRYHLIQMVLRDPRNTSVSTAQFRFWVKKMFNLQKGTSEVVYHDGKPVAMKEQIYDILVKAHRDAHHGGRDKTSALVRKRFSWIPKELVARFVRHCPYCITRRNTGHSPSLMTRSPRSVSTRFSCSFDSNQPIRTPSSIKEESDVSESGYEHTLTYPALSCSPSPQKSYITDSKDEPEFLAYELLNRSSPNLTLAHPQPPSPLFYNTGYSFYNASYNTNYYPTALEITTSTSPGAAVAVAAASSTAASAAAAAAAITSSLLSHNDHYTEETRNNHFSSYNMPENAFI